MCPEVHKTAQVFWDSYWQIEKDMAGQDDVNKRRSVWLSDLKAGRIVGEYETAPEDVEYYNAGVKRARKRHSMSPEGQKHIKSMGNTIPASGIPPEKMQQIRDKQKADMGDDWDPNAPLTINFSIDKQALKAASNVQVDFGVAKMLEEMKEKNEAQQEAEKREKDDEFRRRAIEHEKRKLGNGGDL
jgi:hypothetical protein